MKKKIIYIAAVFLMLAVAVKCSKIVKVTDAITNPTAREVYAREFKNDTVVFANWQRAYSASVNDSLEISLPYGEKGVFSKGRTVAYSYNFSLEEGEVLVVDVAKDSLNQRVFIDLFEKSDSIYRHIESNKINSASIVFEPKQSGVYKLVVQPEIMASGNFFISIAKKPGYGFPVSGHGNSAIGSFWGMERDGGKRNHEGIDIFAKRGTPVVAVTNGTISRTGDQGLGGKQVWQRDGLFGYSIYYAHLDSINTEGGRRVKTGDTIGFVGNTGNAKFTLPHLHFGIYKGFGGAINPLPFVYKIPEVNAAQFPRNYTVKTLKIKSKANIRKGPEAAYAKIGELKANDTVTLLGQHKDWLHIKTATGQQAFISKTLVKNI